MSELLLNNNIELSSAAFAKAASIRVSPQKLNLVAALIRGKKASEAAVQLQFCKKKVSYEVRNVLMSAIANAEHNFSLDIDNLYVSRVLIGKSITMKRFSPRARGRAGKIKKVFSNLTIIVEERG